jgi:hypothetical protein
MSIIYSCRFPIANDLKRSGEAIRPWLSVGEQDDVSADAVKSVERTERHLAIIV